MRRALQRTQLFGEPHIIQIVHATGGHSHPRGRQRLGRDDLRLADYEVRTWLGWYHHQALALTATWVLTVEARRGKKGTPALTVTQLQKLIAGMLQRRLGISRSAYQCGTASRRLYRKEEGRFYRWKQLNRLLPLRVSQQK